MQSGWFLKRLSFNQYIFQLKDGGSIKIHGNEPVVIELVEYDLHVSPKDFFFIYSSRARGWCRELQGYIFPGIVKFHADPASINCSTEKLELWKNYDFNQALKELVLDRPAHPRAKELYQDQNWPALVREFRVSPEALSQYMTIHSIEVMMAYLVNMLIFKMEQKSASTVSLKEVTIPETQQAKFEAMRALISQGVVVLDEKNETATLGFLKRTKPIETPTYPSWHRFLRKRQIPRFAFPVEHPAFGTDPLRIRLEIESKFNNNVDCVQQAISKYVNPVNVYLHVNCYTRETIAMHNTSKRIVRLVPCMLTEDTYVIDGERVSFAEVNKNYKNCHPMGYEDICTIPPGAAHMIICVDAYTPEWVLLDAHFAAKNKTLICVFVRSTN
jgi:hypothetical protein